MLRLRLSSFAALALLFATGADFARTPVDDDAPHAHRSAEAERKAVSAAHRKFSLGKLVSDPNQEAWDVGFVALDLEFTDGGLVSGTVDFTVEVLMGPLSEVVLDLDDALVAHAASAGGAATVFAHLGDLLTVQLDRAYAAGETAEFSVSYSGQPDAAQGAFGVASVSGSPLIWSLSEPFGARTWWPCKDTPSDKPDSASIHFTVPSTMTAVSNGTLEAVVDLGATRRFEWFERYPIATYLISIAAYAYTEQTVNWMSTTGSTMPVTVWSWPSQAGSALSAANQTAQMLDVFESDFGPYPFVEEKYGQAQFTWGGGMEHQTASSMCCWGPPWLLAHELAHQWYGDQVTCASFTDIWVNEGFATYAEALWREATEGTAGYIDEMRLSRYLGEGTIRVPESELDDFARVFSTGLSYNKASWVLHMLRGVIGDADFFDFLKAYAADPVVSYGVATTADVQRVAEDISGLDLAAFFSQWIDVPWYPSFQLDWTAQEIAGEYEVEITLEQLQKDHVFEMPVPVRIVTAGGTVDHVVDVDAAFEQATFPSLEPPLEVQLDPDDWVLHAVEPEIASPSFDRGILVVNGVDWGSYSAITTAYADSALSGFQDFEFWDLFDAPGGGYVSQLPPPRGHGAIPPEILGEYSAVIWVGNDYLGDLSPWLDAAILSYLDKGGNLLLLSRHGQSFLTQLRKEYLGVGFATGSYTTVGDAIAQFPGLVSMSRSGTQSGVSPLATSFDQPETQLLFTDGADPSRALGVWRRPATGGSVRTLGGHFVHLAGRPYRWDRSQLRQNVDVILTQIMDEPLGPVAVDGTPSAHTRLLDPVPNPFNPRVNLHFEVAGGPRPVRIEIFDLRGRRVRRLLDESRPTGRFAVVWDGRDDQGHDVSSGVYTVLMRAGPLRDRAKLTLVR